MDMNILARGGVFMIFIIGASIIAFSIIIERLVVLIKNGKDTTGFISKTKDLVLTGKVDQAVSLVDSVKLPVAQLIRTILVHREKSREDLEKLVQAEAQREIPLLETRLSALNTVATISPLLGLLGTVSGMIKAFSVISKGNVADAALAGHISEALLTTASGLLVAIPCIIMYNYFERKIEVIVNDMEIHSTELIDLIKNK